jgi:hypothetical protein
MTPLQKKLRQLELGLNDTAQARRLWSSLPVAAQNNAAQQLARLLLKAAKATSRVVPSRNGKDPNP